MKIKIINDRRWTAGVDLTGKEFEVVREVPAGYICKIPEASYLEPMNQIVEKDDCIVKEGYDFVSYLHDVRHTFKIMLEYFQPIYRFAADLSYVLFRHTLNTIVIEAEQYTKYGKLVKGMCNSVSCSFTSGNNRPHVHTIHDNQIVNLEIGDYIIPEPDGIHYYPCKADIFEKTYEKIT